MATGLPVNRARILACAAANASEGLSLCVTRKNSGPAVVEEDDVKALRTVARGNAGPERSVRIHAFASGRARQHLQHHLKIAKTRDDLFDACQRDERARQRET